MMERFTAVFEQDGDWWIGYVEELPGANTQGHTIEEARENLIEAVQLIIEANRELARRDAKGRKVVREQLLVAVGL
jgi:predicted RNase H-like HicB family nuclease